MKFKKHALSLFALIICALSLFSCEQAISSALSPDDATLQAEIDSLKQKVNSQAELISSLLAEKEQEVLKEDTENEKSESVSESQSNVQSSDFEYVKENGGITITKYTGKQTSVRIPEKIEGLSVLKIGKSAFADTKVKTVTLPSSCKSVDWFAFYGCYALNTVYVSERVGEIGYAAFEGCSKGLTIVCPSSSYAEKYAKSFGISYSIAN